MWLKLYGLVSFEHWIELALSMSANNDVSGQADILVPPPRRVGPLLFVKLDA